MKIMKEKLKRVLFSIFVFVFKACLSKALSKWKLSKFLSSKVYYVFLLYTFEDKKLTVNFFKTSKSLRVFFWF